MDNQSISTEEQIKDVLHKRIKAIYDKDVESILALYIPDVISFDLMAPLQNKGVEGISRRLREWLASYKGPINQEMDQLTIYSAGDIAYSFCMTRTFGTSVKGEKFDMWYRTTTGFSKKSDQWLIIHEHISEPIDMETGKALFDLKP